MYRHNKMSRMRGIACLLILFALLTAWAFAETSEAEEPAVNYMVQEQTDPEEVAKAVEEAARSRRIRKSTYSRA